MNNNTKMLEQRVTTDLAASLTNDPAAWKWRSTDFDMISGPGGIVMSAHFLTVYQPVKVTFGFWNRCHIRKALKRWKVSVGNDLADNDHERALLTLRRCLVSLRAAA